MLHSPFGQSLTDTRSSATYSMYHANSNSFHTNSNELIAEDSVSFLEFNRKLAIILCSIYPTKIFNFFFSSIDLVHIISNFHKTSQKSEARPYGAWKILNWLLS